VYENPSCQGGSHGRWSLLVLAISLVVAAAFVVVGCGDDVNTFKPPGEESPFLALTSPENVLQNLETSYNLLDCNHFGELLHEDFIFEFNEDDVVKYPDEVPREGYWGYFDELRATCNMLDTSRIPPDPYYKVKDVEMITLALLEPLVPSNEEGAPPGTVDAEAGLELWVIANDGWLTFFVRSRPHFYFVPDSTQAPPIWRIWKCMDGPYDDEPFYGAVGTSRPQCGGGAPRMIGPSRIVLDNVALRTRGASHSTWGAVKSLYRLEE
jgi:hypothetical protein